MRLYLAMATLLLFGTAGANLSVCPSGCQYSTIQAAIDAANSGDTIEVHSGTYNEAVNGNKRVTIKEIDTGGGAPHVTGGYKITVSNFNVIPPETSAKVSSQNLKENSLSAIKIKSKINGDDASSPAGAEVPLGEMINWSFEITNTAGTPLSGLEVNDSRFDVYPIYKSGDANGDVLLDPGEVWIFEAQSIAEEGSQKNVAEVCGLDSSRNRLCDLDSCYYSGVAGRPKTDLGDLQNFKLLKPSIAPAKQEANSRRENDLSAEVLYSTDLSNSDTWRDIGSYQINENGRRHITVSRSNWYSCHCPTKKPFSDFVLEVEATMEGGPKDNAYGVVLRQQPFGNDFYRFKISGDGYFGFDIRRFGVWKDLVPWTKSDAIKTGKASNQIRVECQGSKFSCEVNGVKLGECTDRTFASGMAGIIAESYSQGGVQVAFGNFTIKELPR